MKPKPPLTDYDRLKSAIGRGLGCACELCCEDIEIEIAALRRKAERVDDLNARLTAAMRFVPTPEEMTEEDDAELIELVLWLRGKE